MTRKCPHCQFEQSDELDECLKCGIVFIKYNAQAAHNRRPATEAQADRSPSALRALMLPAPENPSPIVVAGRGALLLALLIWSYPFIFSPVAANYAGQSFMHLVNLPFHEAGHIFFSPFGRLIQALGGSLGQLTMPLICVAVLLIRTRDAFGASVATWWLAESCMDVAPYINDARALDLMLLGGVTGKQVEGYHDWEYILRKLGLLQLDHFLAATTQAIGIVLMVSALVWAFMNIWLQVKCLRMTKPSQSA